MQLKHFHCRRIIEAYTEVMKTTDLCGAMRRHKCSTYAIFHIGFFMVFYHLWFSVNESSCSFAVVFWRHIEIQLFRESVEVSLLPLCSFVHVSFDPLAFDLRCHIWLHSTTEGQRSKCCLLCVSVTYESPTSSTVIFNPLHMTVNCWFHRAHRGLTVLTQRGGGGGGGDNPHPFSERDVY